VCCFLLPLGYSFLRGGRVGKRGGGCGGCGGMGGIGGLWLWLWMWIRIRIRIRVGDDDGMRVLLDHAGYGVRHAREGVRPREGRGARVAREIDDQEVVIREKMRDDVGPFEIARGDAVEEDEGCLGGWVEGEEEEFLLCLILLLFL